MSTPFHVGGIYRNGFGALCRITGENEQGAIVETVIPVLKLAGYWNLITGHHDCGECNLSLRHGEWHCVDGQWVPLEQPTLSLGAILRGEMVSQKKLTSETDPRLAEIARDMRKRGPLPYREEEKKRAEFDRFAGFTVTSGGMRQAQPTGHAFQRLGDASDPLHGSAHISRKKA